MFSLRYGSSRFFHSGFPGGCPEGTGCPHRADFAMTGHIEVLFIFTHIASADLHPLQINRFVPEIGVGDFPLFAAGMGKPAIAQIDADMGDASAMFVA